MVVDVAGQGSRATGPGERLDDAEYAGELVSILGDDFLRHRFGRFPVAELSRGAPEFIEFHVRPGVEGFAGGGLVLPGCPSVSRLVAAESMAPESNSIVTSSNVSVHRSSTSSTLVGEFGGR